MSRWSLICLSLPNIVTDYRKESEDLNEPEYKVSPAAGNLRAASDGQPQGHCQPAEQPAEQLEEQLAEQFPGEHQPVELGE